MTPRRASLTTVRLARLGPGAIDIACHSSEMLLHETITESVIGAFYAAYDKLGYGFLENVYCAALVLELKRRNHVVGRSVSVPVYYDGIKIALYRMDFVVDNAVILEVKSTAALVEADHRQLVNYLRCTTFEVGLLLHFGPKPRFYRHIATEEFKK